jgi:hypothetical protein
MDRATGVREDGTDALMADDAKASMAFKMFGKGTMISDH